MTSDPEPGRSRSEHEVRADRQHSADAQQEARQGRFAAATRPQSQPERPVARKRQSTPMQREREEPVVARGATQRSATAQRRSGPAAPDQADPGAATQPGSSVAADPQPGVPSSRPGPDVLEAETASVAAGLSEAVEVMDRLWRFGGWEVTQTHDSLRPYLLEETYELLDAIQEEDPGTIREELGDLLLQVLFHSRIAEAAGEFTIDDVAAALVAKLVNRSPHLADAQAPGFDPHASVTEKVAAQEKAWEERKSAEKSRRSCLDGIAMAQPALALAEKVRSRSARAGLPDDLIPEDLRVVRLGGPESAEERLRKATLRFAGAIRLAEDTAEAARGARLPLSAEDWHKYWPTARSQER